MVRITIPLPPVTKKNSQRIVMVRSRPMILPSQKYREYERDAGSCLLPYRKRLDSPVNVRCLYYMPTRRRVDLCNLLEATCDLLVHHGVLADDNSAIVAGWIWPMTTSARARSAPPAIRSCCRPM